MAAAESISMEKAIANMMRPILEEYCRKQTEYLNAKFDELTESLKNKIDKQTENISEMIEKQAKKICEIINERTIIIESTKEQTFVINNDNSREVINTREECKIKIQRSYLVSKNIQFAGYTHSIKTRKKTLRVKQLKRNICDENTQHCEPKHTNYHHNYDRSDKPPIRNTTQNCDNYNINYTHGKYRTSDNYSNNKCDYNYKNYRDYRKRRTKICSSVYIERIQQTANMEQVSYAVTHSRSVTMECLNEGRTILYDNGYYTSRNNIFPVDRHNALCSLS